MTTNEALDLFLEETETQDPMVVEGEGGTVELQTDHAILTLHRDGTWTMQDFRH